MAKLYADLIERGLWTIDKVPARFKDEVAELLEKE